MEIQIKAKMSHTHNTTLSNIVIFKLCSDSASQAKERRESSLMAMHGKGAVLRGCFRSRHNNGIDS